MTHNVYDQYSLNAALTAPEPDIDIIVTSSFTMTSFVNVLSGKTVTMISDVGGPYVITRGSAGAYNLFTVPVGSSLSISDLVLDGNKGDYPNALRALIRNDGGTLSIHEGAVLLNNANPYSGGGAIESGGELLMTGGEISGNAALSGGGILHSSTAPITITGTSRITDNSAPNGNGGGIGIDFAYLPSLNVGADVVFADNSASRAFNRNPDDDATYYAHISGTQWTYPFIQGYNNYDIEYTNGTPAEPETVDVAIGVEKTVCGACLCAEMFTFGLFDYAYNEVSRQTNDAFGCVKFPVIIFDQAGVYTYLVRELNPDGNGWTVDERVFTIIVTITADSGGVLTARLSYPDGLPIFVNHYRNPCENCSFGGR